MARSPYSSPFARLTSTVTVDGECWIADGTKLCRGGYHRTNFWVPALGRIVALSSHIATWCAQEACADTANDLYLAYLEFRCSGLELDHTCEQPGCRRPKHLDPVTHAVNVQRMYERRAARLLKACA
jgi:hypothetical protein